MKCACPTASPLGQPPHSPLPNHGHRFDTLQGSPGTLEGAIALSQPDPLLHRPMILFHYIVEVLALPQPNSARERPFRFQPFYGRRICRVLVDIDDPWHGIARGTQSLTEEAFSSGSISLGGEQKLDRLTGRVHRTVEIFVLTFNLYIGLVGTVALVGGFQIWAAALVQLRCIGPGPGLRRVLDEIVPPDLPGDQHCVV